MLKVNNKKEIIKITNHNTPIISEKKQVEDNRSYEVRLREDYNFKVGDLFVDVKNGTYYKIDEILTTYEWKSRGIQREMSFNEEILHISHLWRNNNDEEYEWGTYGTFTVKRLLDQLQKRDSWARIPSIEAYEKKIDELAKNFNNLEEAYGKINDEKTSDSTDLMRQDKESLKVMQDIYKNRKNEILVLESLMNKKIRELEVIKDRFATVVYKIKEVIDNIELYLGIKEDIVQIQIGERAPVDTPITLRQKILYMDEEVGITTGGGLDWKSIDQFDEWLLDDNHLDLIMPEKKGIVILRVRRKDKKYDENPFLNSVINESNHQTYFLIRNGNCVFRIYANIIIRDRLFPGRDEIRKIEENEDYFKHKNLGDTLNEYRKNLLVIQGILDRSDILAPLSRKINLFKDSGIDGLINLVYDDERLLPDGRVTYSQWKKQLNSYNKVGSRILYSGVQTSYDEGEARKVSKYTRSPKRGVYNLERKSTGTWHKFDFVFLYHPGDDVFAYDWKHGYHFRERKRRAKFEVYKDDYCIINYDHITLDDLDFYIYNRNEREHYLEIIPLLKQVKEEKLKEEKEEMLFKDLMVREFGKDVNDILYRKLVMDGIKWWKNKVIQKRPLVRDDKKAFKMIKTFVKQQLEK